MYPNQVAGQPAANIRSLVFEGVAALSVNELRAQFASKEGQPLSLNLLENDIQNLLARYNLEGYVFCSAQSVVKYDEDSSSARVTIVVKEGHPVVIGSVQMIGSLPPEGLAADVTPGLNRGEAFHPRSIEQGIQRLLTALESRGYPFARVSIGQIGFTPGLEVDSASVTLSVDAGEKVTVTQVVVEGNSATKSSVIEREVDFAKNGPFSDKTALAIKRRLERLRLFTSVSMPELIVKESGEGGILIRVKEGDPNRFDGILGYVPSSGSQKGYVTGLVDLEFRNIFGTARSLSARWMRENSSTQDLALKYREPWVASVPIDAELGFDQRKQDSTYLRRAYEIAASYSVSEMVSVGLSFRQSSVFPSERTNNPVVGSETWWLGGRVAYNGRDNDGNPTEGVFYQSSYEAGTKSASNGNVTRVSRVTLDLEYYLPVVSRQVLAAAIRGRDIKSSALEQSDLVRLGGTSTMRGYRESQFLCSRAVWMNLEYRFLLGQRSQFFGFVDGGYLSLQDRPAAGLVGSEQSKIGYGFGARVDSAIGVIGFSIGVGEGDTFRTAKLHIRLMNEF